MKSNKNFNSSVPLVVGHTYLSSADGFGSGGEGVARVDGFALFVPRLLPGETANITVTEVRKNFARGYVAELQEASPERVTPPCPVFGRCGGCQLQHMTYAAQLAAKHQIVQDAIVRIAKMPELLIHPVLEAQSPWNYRNKAQFPVGLVDRQLAAGCFAAGSHDVIAVEDCLIQHQSNNAVLANALRIASELGIPAYNEKKDTGVLRHIMGRVGEKSGDIMAVLVTRTRDFKDRNKFVEQLLAAVPNLTGIIQNVNAKKTNVILGTQSTVLWGQPHIREFIGQIKYSISTESFFQINTKQTEKLYDTVSRFAGLTGRETLADLYCGTGTIALYLAGRAGKVYGIESTPSAIEDARKNAIENKISNVEFICGDVVKMLPGLFKKDQKPSIFVLDPPRSGCAPELLTELLKFKPDRIVYVSCNPASLARDLVLLKDLGYQTKEIQPVDMFPQTWHVECVVRIERI